MKMGIILWMLHDNEMEMKPHCFNSHYLKPNGISIQVRIPFSEIYLPYIIFRVLQVFIHKLQKFLNYTCSEII